MAEFAWNSRKLLRVLFEAQASFRLHRSSKKNIRLREKTVASKLVDLSVGGCGLESPSFLPVGVKLNVFINRALLTPGKGKRYSKIVGIVKTCRQIPNRKYRLGVEFEKVSSEDAKLIRSLVENQERREDKRIVFPK
jgi:c-di-GMP-binding flagellar brake protein YcgR